MAFILNMDSSTEKASIALARDGETLFMAVNDNQRDHAGWIHVAIAAGLREIGERPESLEAIGVTSGPGSYTGLRVGMATAKGLCYALGIPLMTVNTLEAMALSVKRTNVSWVCPMIDARRMEVFTALY